MSQHTDQQSPNRILVLIHGIRTRALWQEKLEAEIPENAFRKIYRLKYGRFDILRFWLPTPMRSQPTRRLQRDLLTIRDAHPDCTLTLLAHSYGTYALARILATTKLSIELIILAGSIIPDRFDWTRLASQVGRIVNDCGMQDIWPPLAKTTTFGYGATGTYGIGRARVEDRYFNCGHDGFFIKNFVRRYWIPLLVSGKARLSPAHRNRYYTGPVRVLGALFPGALALLALLLAVGGAAVAWSTRESAVIGLVPTVQVVLVTLLVVGILLLLYASREAWSGPHYECRRVLQRELVEVVQLSRGFFDAVPSRDAVRGIYKVNNKVFFFVDKVSRGVRSQRRAHVGCFSLLPLKKSAVDLLEEERLIGLEMGPEHVAGPREEVGGLYIGSIAARGFGARGYVLAYVEGRLQTEAERELRVFTRPITKVGLKLVEKYDFEPVGGEGEGGIGRLYKRVFE